MGIPNEALPGIRHNRQFEPERFTVPVHTNPTGARATSDAGGEIARTALPEAGWQRAARGLPSAPPTGGREPDGVYERHNPSNVQDWRNPKTD
jgi:hypothetical protein